MKLAVHLIAQRFGPAAQDTPEESKATGVVPKPSIIINIQVGMKLVFRRVRGANQLHDLGKFEDEGVE